MDRNFINKYVYDLKCNILNEIRNELPNGIHFFKEPFFIHYIEGEVATTEICVAVEVSQSECQMVKIHHKSEGYGMYDKDITDGEEVLCYTIESLADVLFNLKSDYRKNKLSKIIDLVRNEGGRMTFDGSFTFCGDDGSTCLYECENTKLIGLFLDSKGNLNVEDIWEGDKYINSERFLPDSELDRIIKYLESQVKHKYSIKVIASNIYDVEATSYEEAVELVKKKIEEEPLKNADIDSISKVLI
jgi:hypothetical protein